MVSVYRVTSSWTETGATWTNMNANYNATPIWSTTIGTTKNIYYQWNITSLAQSWVNYTVPNYGLMVIIDSPTGNNNRHFGSSEDTRDYPYLQLIYTS